MIIVTGLPGAGKTTVLNEVQKKGYKVVSFGTVMFELAKEKYNIENRDELRSKLTYAQQKELQIKTAERIAKGDADIVDTHCSVKTPRGYLPGLPLYVLEKIPAKIIVLIVATPEEILARRRKDTTRERDKESIRDIEYQDFMNKAFLASYATIKGIPAKIVHNEEGKIEETANKIVKLIKEE